MNFGVTSHFLRIVGFSRNDRLKHPLNPGFGVFPGFQEKPIKPGFGGFYT